jgi:hypothetical protein
MPLVKDLLDKQHETNATLLKLFNCTDWSYHPIDNCLTRYWLRLPHNLAISSKPFTSNPIDYWGSMLLDYEKQWEYEGFTMFCVSLDETPSFLFVFDNSLQCIDPEIINFYIQKQSASSFTIK